MCEQTVRLQLGFGGWKRGSILNALLLNNVAVVWVIRRSITPLMGLRVERSAPSDSAIGMGRINDW